MTALRSGDSVQLDQVSAGGPLLHGPTGPSVAIIGGGMIAEVHRRAILLSGGRLRGVLGSRPERSLQLASTWRAERAYRSLDELLRDEVEVVHVCTPNASHMQYTIAAADAGKHVVCEKPLGMDVEQARAIRDAVHRAGVVGAVPFVYRYHPLVREIRERRRSGEFGRVALLHGSYLQDWLSSANDYSWRIDPVLQGPSRAFADIGTHWCDLVGWVSGEVFSHVFADFSTVHARRLARSSRAAEASATEGVALLDVDTEDAATVLLRTESGVHGAMIASQVSPGRKNRLWFEIDGTEGSAVFNQEQPETAWLGGRDSTSILTRNPNAGHPEATRLYQLPVGHPQGYAECFENFLRDTYAAVRGVAVPGLPTVDDGLRSAELVDAVIRSVAAGSWAPIRSSSEL